MTKLLFRRWYFSAPLLLVTMVLVGAASVTVKPDYSAKGHIQFIPPVGTVSKLTGEKNPIDNPWFDLGYEALANATVIDVTKQSVLEKMVADGLSDNITVTIDQVPLFGIEAVGSSPEQATATVKFVQNAIADAVEQRQQTLKVAKTETITTLQLDDGSEVETKTSKTMRVMVVAAGLGLLLTAGFTIGMDALLRYRARRREEPAESSGGSVIGSAGIDGRGNGSGGAVPPNFEATQAVILPRPANGADRGPNPSEQSPQSPEARPGKVPSVPQQQQRRSSSSSDGTYRSKQNPAVTPDPRLQQAPADATIVLPPWGGRRDEKADRR